MGTFPRREKQKPARIENPRKQLNNVEGWVGMESYRNPHHEYTSVENIMGMKRWEGLRAMPSHAGGPSELPPYHSPRRRL